MTFRTDYSYQQTGRTCQPFFYQYGTVFMTFLLLLSAPSANAQLNARKSAAGNRQSTVNTARTITISAV